MIRWICKNCNRKWIYPVTHCVYCMKDGKIEKEISKKFRVIGISKVNIPSKSHPITPYYAMILEDEHGNRMPKKSMKEYKIGDEYVMEKGDVALIRHKYDLYEAVRLAVDLVGGIEVNASSKVLIKPTCITPAYHYLSMNTNPKVLAAVIKLLLEKGVKAEHITVAEQGPGIPLAVTSKKSGMGVVCKQLGVQLVDIAEKEFVNKNGYDISSIVFGQDLVINLPLMKTDSRFKVAGALENMTRVLSSSSQDKLFNFDIRESMNVVVKELPQQLIIGDAILSLMGNGPLLGEPAFINLIMASKDPVALDEAFCDVIMHETPDYINNTDGNHTPNIAGDDLYGSKVDVMHAEIGATANPDVRIIGASIPPSSYYAVQNAMQKLAGVRGKETYLTMGKFFTKDELSGKRVVAVGDEAIDTMNSMGVTPIASIKGSPPDKADLLVFIKKLLSGDAVSVIDKAKSALLKTMGKS